MPATYLRSALAMGVPFGIAMGIYFHFAHGHGLVPGVTCGVLFGLTMAAFQAYQRKRLGVAGETLDGERLLHQGPANHSAGLEQRGGWLVLTEAALSFRSHGLNAQNAPLRVPLAEISAVLPARTLGILPNAIRVERGAGEPAVFLVSERAEWLRAIEAARAR